MAKFFTPEVEAFFGKLVGACGISGNSQEVHQLVSSYVKAPHIQIDSQWDDLGIFHATYQADHPFQVMLGSHLDTVGMRVSFINPQNFLYFIPVGGIDVHSLKGRRVWVHAHGGPYPGIIQALPIHHTEPEARNKAHKLDQMYIRTEFVGQKSHPFREGDPVIFDEPIAKMGDGLLMGPGFDNRLGVLLMVEVMRRLSSEKISIGVHALGTSGEEIGCRGVRSTTQKINPKLAIALDVTNATDYPGCNKKKFGDQKLGGGPIIARGYNTRTKYNELLMEVAKENNIPFQIRAEDITPTDGREMDEAGVATLVVRVPSSMLHTANDCVHRDDIEHTAQLLFAFLKRLPD